MTETRPKFDLDVIDRAIRANIPHCGELGVRTTAFATDGVVMELDYQERLVGNPATGVLHGGVITVLADTVSGMAVYGAVQKMIPIATLDLRIDYLKPATPGRTLLARAECYKSTRSIAFTRGTVYHDPEDPIASMVGTFMFNSSRAASPSSAGADAAQRGLS
jgi:uncharacterized protein (TIGR00369 family)